MLYKYKQTPFLRETKNSSSIQLNLDLQSAKGLGKLARYIEGSLYRGSFPYIYYKWADENRSLYRRIRYIEVR